MAIDEEDLQGVKLNTSRISQLETHFQQMSKTENQIIDGLTSNELVWFGLAIESHCSRAIQHTSSVRWENMTSLHRLR